MYLSMQKLFDVVFLNNKFDINCTRDNLTLPRLDYFENGKARGSK